MTDKYRKLNRRRPEKSNKVFSSLPQNLFFCQSLTEEFAALSNSIYLYLYLYLPLNAQIYILHYILLNPAIRLIKFVTVIYRVVLIRPFRTRAQKDELEPPWSYIYKIITFFIKHENTYPFPSFSSYLDLQPFGSS